MIIGVWRSSATIIEQSLTGKTKKTVHHQQNPTKQEKATKYESEPDTRARRMRDKEQDSKDHFLGKLFEILIPHKFFYCYIYWNPLQRQSVNGVPSV